MSELDYCDNVDSTDAIALVVLVIILAIVAFIAPTQTSRYVFMGIFLLYLVLYLSNKVTEISRKKSDGRYKWKDEEAYREAYEENVNGVRRRYKN